MAHAENALRMLDICVAQLTEPNKACDPIKEGHKYAIFLNEEKKSFENSSQKIMGISRTLIDEMKPWDWIPGSAPSYEVITGKSDETRVFLQLTITLFILTSTERA